MLSLIMLNPIMLSRRDITGHQSIANRVTERNRPEVIGDTMNGEAMIGAGAMGVENAASRNGATKGGVGMVATLFAWTAADINGCLACRDNLRQGMPGTIGKCSVLTRAFCNHSNNLSFS